VHLRNWQDLGAGLIFVVFGGTAMVVARHYPLGAASRMGPGYFPTIVGGLLVLLGVAVAARGLRRPGPPTARPALRPILVVVVAVVAFALLVDSAGLVVAGATLIVVSRLGWWELRVVETVVLTVALTALTIVLFVWGLGLPFRVWPAG
jgi:hypothetical protein